MPGGDGTGPRGDGPMTGWGMGFCAQPVDENKDRPADQGPRPGFWRRLGGFGWGRGFGRGVGRGRRGGAGRGFGR